MSGDNWNFNGSNPCVYRGGNYGRNDNHGLFYRNYTNATNTNGNHGSRHLLHSFANIPQILRGVSRSPWTR